MTDDSHHRTPEDDLFAQDEASTHRFIAGHTGTGKTARLIELAAAIHAESAPEWFDLKVDDEGMIDGGEN